MKRWYVVQVYAGSEEMVYTSLLKHSQEEALKEKIGLILVPTAKSKSAFVDTTEEKEEQLFPGYLLIEAEMSPEVFRTVVSTPRVIKLLGGKTPIPLDRADIERVLRQMKGEVIVTARKSDFVVGGEIDIKEGPFAGFVGIIEEIDEEKERLTVMVSILGRMTPVELSFNQVKQ